jgi:hypothetical protein
VTDNLGFGIGGLIGGLIATTQVPGASTSSSRWTPAPSSRS